FFQAEDGIRDGHVTGVQTCALPIFQKINQLEKKVFDFERDTKQSNGKMKTASYHAGKLLVKLVFGCIALIRAIGRENPNRSGGRSEERRVGKECRLQWLQER